MSIQPSSSCLAILSHAAPAPRLPWFTGSAVLCVLLAFLVAETGVGLDADFSSSLTSESIGRERHVHPRFMRRDTDSMAQGMSSWPSNTNDDQSRNWDDTEDSTSFSSNVEISQDTFGRNDSVGNQSGMPMDEPNASVSNQSGVPMHKPDSSVGNQSQMPMHEPNSSVGNQSGVPIDEPNASVSNRSGVPMHEPDSSAGNQSQMPIQEQNSSVGNQSRVLIHVYYESKCPYSLGFLNETLLPLWKDTQMRNYLDIKLFPYGNAVAIPNEHVSEGYKFWHPEAVGYPYVHVCQHGPDECFGNTVQACMLNHLDPDISLAIIFCMAGVPSWSLEKASFECMSNSSVSLEELQTVADCVHGAAGNQLLNTLAAETAAVNVTMVPWILIDTMEANRSTFTSDVCAAVAQIADEEDGGIPAPCISFLSDLHGAEWTVVASIDGPGRVSLAGRPFASYVDAEGGYRPVMTRMLEVPEEPEGPDETAEVSDAR